MSLPASRDQTFTPFSVVPSTFLNHVQDVIISNTLGTRWFFPWGFDPSAVWTLSAGSGVFQVGSNTAIGASWSIPILLAEKQIVDISVKVQHANATLNAIRARLFKGGDGTGNAIEGSPAFSAASTAVQTLTMVTGYTVLASKAYLVEVDTNAGTGGAMNRSIFAVGVNVTGHA